MNSQDRKYLDAKIDPVLEGVQEIKKALIDVGMRVNKVEVKQAKADWHDWAIKGGITGLAGLVVNAVYQWIKH